jgi:hypothetical protein
MSDKSDFIKQLHADIAKQQAIHKDPIKFIKHKNLRKIQFKHQRGAISENDFPFEAYLGSVYLIKGKNIIGMYCWCDCKHSLYLQINRFAPRWICKTELYNLEPGDPEQIKYYLDGMEVLFSSDTAQYLMLQFVHSGFDMYI